MQLNDLPEKVINLVVIDVKCLGPAFILSKRLRDRIEDILAHQRRDAMLDRVDAGDGTDNGKAPCRFQTEAMEGAGLTSTVIELDPQPACCRGRRGQVESWGQPYVAGW